MSVGASFAATERVRHPVLVRLAIAACAIAVATALLSLLAWLVAPGIAAPPPRSPFGIGFREAAPSATGLGGWLLAVQSSFSQNLRAAVAALKQDGAWGPIVGIGFAYGIFHAVGPGHGKAVIAGYIVASERALRLGIGLSFAAALLQAAIPIAMVAIGWYVLDATHGGMDRTGMLIETAGFAFVAALGAFVTWRKAGRLAALAARDVAASTCAPGCGHALLADGSQIERLDTWRQRVAVVLAAGARPCIGAVTLLVLSASQGLFAAGIVATLAMGLGTALTTSALASLAVFAKGLALRLAGGRGMGGALAIGGLEVLAASFVLVLGVAMLLGFALGLGG